MPMTGSCRQRVCWPKLEVYALIMTSWGEVYLFTYGAVALQLHLLEPAKSPKSRLAISAAGQVKRLGFVNLI
jgi:hypothetical protein